jgi:hypothetical protein
MLYLGMHLHSNVMYRFMVQALQDPPLCSSTEFTRPLTYFFRDMRICIGWIMLAACFCHSRYSQVVYNCALIKVDWLVACIPLRGVGAEFVIILRRCRTIFTVLQPMGSNGRYLKKCPKPCWPIRSKETWTKYMPLTLLRQCTLALTARYTLFA